MQVISPTATPRALPKPLEPLRTTPDPIWGKDRIAFSCPWPTSGVHIKLLTLFHVLILNNTSTSFGGDPSVGKKDTRPEPLVRPGAFSAPPPPAAPRPPPNNRRRPSSPKALWRTPHAGEIGARQGREVGESTQKGGHSRRALI